MSEFFTDVFESLLSPRERASRLQGQWLGNWRLDERLTDGDGGFGVVYRATHRQETFGQAAVKVLAFDLRKQPELRTLFEHEIKILKTLSECDEARRVVTIYDADVYDETLPWFAMQYLPGTPLSRWLKLARESGRPIPPAQIASILCDVLTALDGIQTAYSRRFSSGRPLGSSVVHRDIKPGNVMVYMEGKRVRAHLIDFGITRILNAGPNASSGDVRDPTILDHAALTHAYASPEMLMPYTTRALLDARSDLFQVGLLGFEMLTFERYWDVWPDLARSIRVVRAPVWLKWAVLRALGWDRESRFPDARTFHDSLKNPWRHLLHPSKLWRPPLRVATFGATVGLLITSWCLFLARHQLRHEISRESNTEFELQATTRQLSAKTLEVELLRNTIQKHVPQPTDPARRAVLLLELRYQYSLLKDERADSNEFESLRKHARSFATNFPDDDSHSSVARLADWLDSAAKGHIRVTIDKFVDHSRTVLGRNAAMSIAVEYDGKTALWESHLVTNTVLVGTSVDIPWGLQREAKIKLGYDNATNSDNIKFWTVEILSGNISQKPLKSIQDKDYEVYYSAQRLDFEPLPDFH